MTLNEGDQAPNFKGLDQNNNSISLDNYHSKYIILYFYPKDNTPGCTIESCGFKDIYSEILKYNCDVIGISKDSIKSHKNFETKYALPFKLVADTNAEICRSYGVLKEKSMFGKKYMGIVRSTFLIDPHRKIKKIWRNVKVPNHVSNVLKELTALS